MKITGKKIVALTDNEKEVLKQTRRIVDDLIEEIDDKTIDRYRLYQISDYLSTLIYTDEFIITLDVKENVE